MLGTFVHRPTGVDSYDSICTRCAATVGRKMTLLRLEGLEVDHVCDPITLDRLSAILKRSGTNPALE